MTNRRFTRFLFGFNGNPRLLLKTAPTKDRTLMIFVPTARESDDERFAIPSELVERRYSIHPSRNSNDISLIKGTTKRADGKLIETVNHTQAFKLGGYAIICHTISQDLRPKQYDPNPKERDLVAMVDWMNADINTLEYTLLASRPEEKDISNLAPNEKLFTITCHDYKLSLIYRMHNFPSGTHTNTLAHITDFDAIDRRRRRPAAMGKAQGTFPPESVAALSRAYRAALLVDRNQYLRKKGRLP